MARACGKTVLDCLHSCNNQMNACFYIYVVPSPKTYSSRNITIRIQWNVRSSSMKHKFNFVFHLWVFMARDGLSVIAAQIWNIFFKKKKNSCQALLLLYLVYYCVQISSSVCQQGCSLGKYPYIFHSPTARAWVWERKHHLTFQWIAPGCLLCRLWGWTQVLKMNLRTGKR